MGSRRMAESSILSNNGAQFASVGGRFTHSNCTGGSSFTDSSGLQLHNPSRPTARSQLMRYWPGEGLILRMSLPAHTLELRYQHFENVACITATSFIISQVIEQCGLVSLVVMSVHRAWQKMIAGSRVACYLHSAVTILQQVSDACMQEVFYTLYGCLQFSEQ